MRALFDVSALLALIDPDHVFNAIIRGWWRSNKAGGWATCPLTQNGFVRVMSQRSYPQHRSVAEAAALLQQGMNQPDHQGWTDDVSIADASVFDHRRILGPNQITDAYLLALAVRNTGRLVTFDRGISLSVVREAESPHLVVL